MQGVPSDCRALQGAASSPTVQEWLQDSQPRGQLLPSQSSLHLCLQQTQLTPAPPTQGFAPRVRAGSAPSSVGLGARAAAPHHGAH